MCTHLRHGRQDVPICPRPYAPRRSCYPRDTLLDVVNAENQVRRRQSGLVQADRHRFYPPTAFQATTLYLGSGVVSESLNC
jgi:hypothetical protein